MQTRLLPSALTLAAQALRPTIEETEPDAVTPGALLVVGFPTFGLVGSIVAGYLTSALKMREIGSVSSGGLLPSVVVEDGRARPPIRILSGPVVCGVDGRCDQLICIEAETQPPPFLLVPIADVILGWAQERRIALAISVEGYPADPEVREGPRIGGMANRLGLDTLTFLKLTRITGVATGFSAALLLAGMNPKARVPVICTISQAHPDHPDALAAAKVIEALHPLFPSLEIDTAPLRATAEEIEKSVRQRMNEQSASMGRLGEGSSVNMYG